MTTPEFTTNLRPTVSPFLYLIAFASGLFLFGLGSRDFWAPVEPRYAEIARVMFVKGQWLVPTVNGDLYTDKPIFYFWLVLLGAKLLGGVTEWTVRLPAALGGLGFVAATYLIARELFTVRVAFIAAVMLATSMRVLWEARWAHVDTLFCASFGLALYFGARTVFRKVQPSEVLLVYLFVALATLTKGLIGIVLPGLILGGFILVRRDWSLLARLKLHWGVAIFAIVAVPWFYAVNQLTDGKWVGDFIYIHHIQRYTAGAGHRQPFYYYLTTLPRDFLPWTIFIIPALFAYRPLRSKFADPVVQFFLLWFSAVFLFFSLSSTKRDLYLLPLFPSMAIFLGVYFDDLIQGRIEQGFLYRTLAGSFFALTAVTGLCVPVAAWFYYRDASLAAASVSLPLLIAGVVGFCFVWRLRPLDVMAVTGALMAITVVCASIWLMPYLEVFKSPRWFSNRVRQIVPDSAALFIYADTMNDFNFYTGREIIPVVPDGSALDRLLRSEKSGYLIIKARDLERLPQLTSRSVVVSETKTGSLWHLLKLDARSSSDEN
ncbi:MAG TPA: glycosyltransferase family 39 protein [Candidatus Binatia bacterium]